MSARKQAMAEAHRQLSAALLNGSPPPCPPELALSDDRDERAQVAELFCPGCPYRRLCFEAGRYEKFGVWGGRDCTPPPKGVR